MNFFSTVSSFFHFSRYARTSAECRGQTDQFMLMSFELVWVVFGRVELSEDQAVKRDERFLSKVLRLEAKAFTTIQLKLP